MGGSDNVYCLDAETGKLIWRFPYPCPAGNFYGPRATPTLDVKRRALYVTTGNAFSGTPKTANAVMAMHMDTGKVLWEYSYNVYLSDVPPHRTSWASPAIDPETGNVEASSA